MIERACERLGWTLADLRFVVQGFGNVGGVAATELHERGARVIARRRHLGRRARTRTGSTSRRCTSTSPSTARSRASGGVERITHEKLLELECDVLVLAAREDQVTGANAGNLRCRLVVEGANGPTSVAGDGILAERGIPVLPDVLTNAGGVTVSYFEWVQDLSRLFWDRDEIRRRLAEKLATRSTVSGTSRRSGGISLRNAALVAGIRESPPRSRRGGSTREPMSEQRVRDAMVSEPLALEATATAQEAGEALMRPEVRAVLVCDGGELVGVITRKTLVREVVARGLDPTTTTLGEIAEPPNATIDARPPLAEAFAFLEEHDYERVPVVDGGRLVGVLSRSVVQRRLAEDEEVSDAAGVGRLGRDAGGHVSATSVSKRVAELLADLVVDEAAVARRTSRARGRRRPRPRRRARPSRRAPCGARPAAQTAPNKPALEPITATGLLRNAFVASGREAQSSAFLSAPGIEELYSGVANRTASATRPRAERRRRPPAPARRRRPGRTAAPPQPLPELDVDALRAPPRAGAEQGRRVRGVAERAGDGEDPHRYAA